MNIKRTAAALVPALAMLFGACGEESVASGNENGNDNDGTHETIVFTKSSVKYKGDDGYTEVSDLWEIVLYTDMEVEGGYPVGPGQMMQLALDSELNPDQEPDLSYLVNVYKEAESTSDFSPGTFLQGYGQLFDFPGGYVSMPAFSFFADIAAGETDFDADYLREGRFEIAANSDGTYTIAGILVGHSYLKRYFTYTGELEAVSYVEEKVPNSTLTEDIVLDSFTQSRLRDRGNSHYLPDYDPEDEDADPDKPNSTSYRHFELYLAEPNIQLYETAYPSGEGKLLRLDLYVPYESKVEEGIPAGTYTIVQRTNGGIPREQIVPFNAPEGYADKFSAYEGAWFVNLDSRGGWNDPYARVAGGTITVERTETGGHHIKADLIDSSDPAFKITCDWSSEEPLTVWSGF